MTLQPIEKRAKAIKLAHDKYLAPIIAGGVGAAAANQLPQNQRSSKKAKQKIEETFKKSDNDFANRMYDLVMKMDEDDARLFTTMVMAEVFEDEVSKNLRTLQSHLNKVVSKRIQRIKKATLAKAKDADEEAVAFAKALVQFEKAIQWDPDEHPRGQAGRFRTVIRHDTDRKPLNDSQEKGLGIPTPNRKAEAGVRGYSLKTDDKARAQYQQEYQQIANFLDGVARGSGDGHHNVSMIVENKTNYQQHIVNLHNGKPVAGTHWDPKTERIVEISARPNQLTLGGASFGLANAFGGDMDTGRMQMINQADAKFGDFSRDWNQDTDPYNSNARLYSNVGTAGNFLTQVAPFGSKAQIAGRFAQAIGDRGPEAEQVFGPPIRRSAYRYRGVTKTPEPEVVRQYELAVRNASKSRPTAEQTAARNTAIKRALTRARKEKADVTGTPEDAVTLTREETAQVYASVPTPINEADREEALNSGREVLASDLRSEVDELDKEVYGLHLDAGNTPPSEGFIVDKNGKVVAQAVGYGDDHYLPFNLKNLKALRGGEYLRTRSVGGPTTEDIYTGLMAGAKRITVVSRSGTFEIEFESDFKGGRRYNDKAARMVGRYAHLLDSVQSEKVTRRDVSPATRARISAEVREKRKGYPPKEIHEEIDRKIKEYKAHPDYTGEEAAKQDAYIQRMTANMATEGEKNREATRLRRQFAQDREYQFKLNGEGYFAAMKALKEQFPYYMKVNYKPPNEDEFVSAKDRGYVEPGRLRPTHASAGYHGVVAEDAKWKGHEGKKFSASEADYQRGKYGNNSVPAQSPQTARPKGAPADDTTTPTTADGKLKPTGEKKDSVAAEVAEARAREPFAEAAVAMAGFLRPHLASAAEKNPDVPTQYGMLMMDPAELNEALNDPEKGAANVQKFEDQLASFRSMNSNIKIPTEINDQYKIASGAMGRKPYEHSVALLNPKKAFYFPGDAYVGGKKNKPAFDAEQEKIDANVPVSTDKRYSEMSGPELDAEIKMLAKLHSVVGRVRPDLDVSLEDVLDEEKLPTTNERINELGNDPKQLKHQLEMAHRQKALNLVKDQTNRGEGGESGGTPPTPPSNGGNGGNGGGGTPAPASPAPGGAPSAPGEAAEPEAAPEEPVDVRGKIQGMRNQLELYRVNLRNRGKTIPTHLYGAIYDADKALARPASQSLTQRDFDVLVSSPDYQKSIKDLADDMQNSKTARANWKKDLS